MPATVSYNTNNRVTWVQNSAPNGFAYDPSGDVTGDSMNQYTYDAEGRICAVTNTPIAGISSMTGYLYDADGNRVAKGTITSMSCDPGTNGFQLTESYVLGPGGEELTMLDGNNNWQRTNVYAAGKPIATYDLISDPNSTSPSQIAALHFHLTDPLGTRRMQLSGEIATLGCPETDIQSLPFGDQLFSFPDANAPGSADDATPLHFTGKERDTESGNDYFDARYYSSAMGRFLSPDWSAKEEPVPYAKLDDPQTLNLYSYVRNNPLSGTDPDGHEGPFTISIEPFEGLPPLPNPFHPIVPYPEKYTLTPEKLESAWNNAVETVTGWFSKGASSESQSTPATGQSTPASPEDPNRKEGGSRTEPNLPKKTVANEDGVEIKHFTRSGDHGPAHLHVEGGGESTKIGMNGKPIEGSPELSSTQQSVVNNNLGTIRRAVDAIQRWFNFNSR